MEKVDYFGQYDDPARARKVWKEYAGEINAHGALRRAEGVLMESNRAGELEVKLDLMLTDLKHITIEDQFPAGIDWDATGDYANAAKAVEENREF